LLPLIDRGNAPRLDPPKNQCGPGMRLEPLPSAAEHGDVLAAIDVLVEGLDRFPNRHVEQDPLVVERANAGGIAIVSLEAPDEAGAPVGQRIDAVELRHETSHERIVESRSHAGDVGLSEVMTVARAHSSFLATFEHVFTS